MINILQTPLLRQLGRGLLLYWLLRRNHRSEQEVYGSNEGGLVRDDLEIPYLCRFLLTAVSVPVIFFLLFGFLLLPFFMLLLLLLLSRSIVAGYAVRVLAIVSFPVGVSLHIAVLKRRDERVREREREREEDVEKQRRQLEDKHDSLTDLQSSCVFSL